MAWSTRAYKQINTQGGSDKVFALVVQTDYSINSNTSVATISGRLLMLSSWSAPYASYNHTVVFKINNVQKYNGRLDEPNSTGDWSTSYKQTVNGKSYGYGCLIGSWSQTVPLTENTQSIPVYGSYSVTGSASYLPVKATHVVQGVMSLPAAGAPSGSISVTENTENSAKLTGTVTSWGTYAGAGTSNIRYGITTDYEKEAINDVSFEVSPSTTYYYRYRIINTAGIMTEYSRSFITPGQQEYTRLIYENGVVTNTKTIYLIHDDGTKIEITKDMFNIII